MKIKNLVIMISMILVFSLCANIAPAYASDYKVGDYITFGSYNGKPIVWRIINIDEQGNPMLFSDKILSIKSFDSKGSKHINNNYYREAYGSNYWGESNVRQWLNSSDNSVKWSQNAPAAQNSHNGINGYDSEKGFLAQDNFTAEEKFAIYDAPNKTTLNSADDNKKDGGIGQRLNWSGNISTAVQNYDNVNYQSTKDKVFFLSVKELNNYVYNNKTVLGDNYHIAKPTKDAVTNSKFKDLSLNTDKNWSYWLRTAYDNNTIYGTSAVEYVKEDGSISNFGAAEDLVGIRPALIINKPSVKGVSGSGTAIDPYVLIVNQTKLLVNVLNSSYNNLQKTQDVSLEIKNPTQSTQTASVIVTLLKDNKTVKITTDNLSIAGGEIKNINKHLPLENSQGVIKVKVFVWDSLKGLMPLTNSN